MGVISLPPAWFSLSKGTAGSAFAVRAITIGNGIYHDALCAAFQ